MLYIFHMSNAYMQNIPFVKHFIWLDNFFIITFAINKEIAFTICIKGYYTPTKKLACFVLSQNYHCLFEKSNVCIL